MSANLELVADILNAYASIFANGRIDVFSAGTPPSVNDASLGSYTVLAQITLPANPFQYNSSGYLTNLGNWQGWRNNVAGDMGWFRMYSSDETRWLQGDLSETGGDGMMQLPTLDVPISSFLVVDQVRIDFI